MKRRPLLFDLLLGAAAGAASTWLMDLATTALYEREPEAAREKEDEARGGSSAYETAARKTAKLAGFDLTKEQREQAGLAIHWTLGVGAGAIYGLLRNRIPALGIGTGLAYGTAFWLVMDEGMNYALGLTPGPTAFPWQSHARGLAGHLILGAGVEAAFDIADAVGP